MAEQVENTKLIDEWVEMPEGSTPAKIHIVFNRDTRDWADQYTSALHISRDIPFNLSTIPVTNPLALIISRMFHITDGNVAVQQAKGYYESWAYDALKHGWILALLEDNDFFSQPEPYEEERQPRGLPMIPKPKYDLNNPVEKRLKQIFDTIAVDTNVQVEVMTKINNAFVKLVQEVEEVDDRTGFPADGTDSDVHAEVSPDSDADGKKSTNRRKNKAGSVDPVSVGETTDTPV